VPPRILFDPMLQTKVETASMSDPECDRAMHDPLAKRVAVSFLLLMVATAQILLCVWAGSLTEGLYTQSPDGVAVTYGPVTLRALYADSGDCSCTNTTTTTTTRWNTTTSYSTIPPSTVTQWTTATYTHTVGLVTEFSYLYDTITGATTVYRTQTVSTTRTTSLPTTLTRTSTAFATTETQSVTHNETESTTRTETSYATVSVTQYVYVESYVPGQVIEYATIQRISNGSEGSVHFSKDDEHKIQTITITLAGNATNAKLAIATAPGHAKVGTNMNEYSSFQITATNLSDDNIKSVVIEFKVDRDWLSNNQVPQDKINLYRYENGEWRRLETSLLRTDEKYAYYNAVSPGLSIFAIAGQSSSFFQIPGIGPIANSYALILPIIVIAILGAYGAIRISNARRKSGEEQGDSAPPPAETSSEDQIDAKLLEYITHQGGSISLSKASEDLGVPPATIKEAISRLRNGGKLTPA
jgi:PGF-pre-PGF domain-containing protein